jgi:hypothetical protein
VGGAVHEKLSDVVSEKVVCRFVTGEGLVNTVMLSVLSYSDVDAMPDVTWNVYCVAGVRLL